MYKLTQGLVRGLSLFLDLRIHLSRRRDMVRAPQVAVGDFERAADKRAPAVVSVAGLEALRLLKAFARIIAV